MHSCVDDDRHCLNICDQPQIVGSAAIDHRYDIMDPSPAPTSKLFGRRSSTYYHRLRPAALFQSAAIDLHPIA